MQRNRLRTSAIVLLVAITATLVFFAFRAEQRVFRVAFLDVGQGDAILISSPSGHRMLVDAGRGPVVLAPLGKELSFWKQTIDIVVATHPDEDHVGGMADVLKRYRVGVALDSGVFHDTSSYTAYQDAVVAEHIPHLIARRGMRIDFGDGVIADILSPSYVVQGGDTNPSSIVMRVTYGSEHVMLTGDAPVGIENYLVSKDGAGLQSAILKAGHHGSRTSSSENFIRAVAPNYAIISAGKDNRYGHPNQDVLDRLRSFGATILSTIHLGTIAFESDGRTFVQK